MANKENKQNIEFTGIAVGDKVYFVSKAKAMEFIDGISATKKEEKILNDLTFDDINAAIEKTGVKNPKKLDCGKLARKLLGKKYEKLSGDVQSLARGVISAVANGALSVSAAKDAYDNVKSTIETANEMFDELKEKNDKLIEQVGGDKVVDTEESKTKDKPEKKSDAKKETKDKTAEEKAVDKTLNDLVKSVNIDNCNEVVPKILDLVDGDAIAVGEFCKKNDIFKYLDATGLPEMIASATSDTRKRAEKIKNKTLKKVYDNFFEGIDGMKANHLGSKAYGKSVEKVYDACMFVDKHTSEYVSENDLIEYGISNPIVPDVVDGKCVMVDMFGEVVNDAK